MKWLGKEGNMACFKFFLWEQGSYRSWKSWKVMEFKNFIFQAWKVMEFIYWSWKINVLFGRLYIIVVADDILKARITDV